MHSESWGWALLFLLGAYHGINPAMGWLFAVALGLQRHSGRAVWQALVPIAIGHVAAIAAVIFLAALVGTVIPPIYLKVGVAGALLGFGLYRIVWACHPRMGGMQVGFRDLTVWSFLMATAHGAGLMLLPVLLGWSAAHAHEGHHTGLAATNPQLQVLAVAIHTCGYLLITGLVAWVVYSRLGLSILRTAWFNVDRIWAIALIATAGLTLIFSA